MEDVLFINSMIEPKGGILSAPVIILFITFIALIVLIFVLFFGTIVSIKNTSLTLTGRELIVKSFFYGKKIPVENILVDQVKAVKLDEAEEYKISYRTNGFRLPNMALGWMRLKNKAKALAFVTDKNNVAVIPTKEFVILFSMNNVDDFIKKITNIKMISP